ncbi:MAG: glutathione S-transferase N-terminal domain-containing protein [Pseudomonadota bacterium]|nr:glutathione S-transferase N-terminal domain-containing protein [Pseudomonadota bacterium]
MIDLYSWATPNGQKISIALEELGLAYRLTLINIGANEQFAPNFLALSPNNRIPAIIDHDGPNCHPISLFESGAILFYLAEKTGQLMPQDPTGRANLMQWLMWQMGGFGPMLGQAHHFTMHTEGQDYGKQRYYKEANRLYGVLDRQLAAHEFVVGKDLSIADMAIFPWTRTVWRQGVDLNDYPNVLRWRRMLINRPAFLAGVQVGAAARAETKDMKEQDWVNQFNGVIATS